LKPVSGGSEQIARVPFFGSFLGKQERMKNLLQSFAFLHLYKLALNGNIDDYCC